jgi:hypothetical protein
MTFTERRRAPRVDLVGQLHGKLTSVDVPIVVREISLGGMSFQTSSPFDVNSRHEFLLTLGDGAGILVGGRVAYCNRSVDRLAGAVFVVGIQFLDDDRDDPNGDVGQIMKRVH